MSVDQVSVRPVKHIAPMERVVVLVKNCALACNTTPKFKDCSVLPLVLNARVLAMFAFCNCHHCEFLTRRVFWESEQFCLMCQEAPTYCPGRVNCVHKFYSAVATSNSQIW